MHPVEYHRSMVKAATTMHHALLTLRRAASEVDHATNDQFIGHSARTVAKDVEILYNRTLQETNEARRAQERWIATATEDELTAQNLMPWELPDTHPQYAPPF